MKITDVSTNHYNNITIGNDEYIRFSPAAWYKFYGNSLEPVFYTEEILELETLYQEYIRTSGNRSG